MAERRKLSFSTESEAISDVEQLRIGFVKAGTWNLPQICFHLAYPIDHSLHLPTTMELTDKQRGAQGFLEQVIASGWPAGHFDPPEPMRPPADVNPAAVGGLIDSLKQMSQYNASHVDAFLFGPVATQKFRRFALVHAAHHLSFLSPTIGRRSELRYSSETDLLADVSRLRKGYKQTATWNLQQICCHLAKAMEFSMRPGPFPEVTDEQRARRGVLDSVLASGQLPGGINAPDPMMPPADCTDAEIDRMLLTLEKARTYPGPFGPHRLFGPLTNDEARRLRFIHAAHHFSYLIPI
jgi:Protein of unknown function (DUF1569)